MLGDRPRTSEMKDERISGEEGGAKTVLTEIRVDTLRRYGTEANLTARYPDPTERAAALHAPGSPA